MKLTVVPEPIEGVRVVANGEEGVIVRAEVLLRVRYDHGGEETLSQEFVEYHPKYQEKS